MPGAWISGQLRARAVSPGKFNPVIYVAKCWVPAAPHRLLFPGTEEVTEASFTTTSRCLRVPRTAGRTAQMQTTDVLVGERREPTCLQQLGDVADHIGCELDAHRLLNWVVRLAGLGHENHLPRVTSWSKTSCERLSVARHRRRRPEARVVRLRHHHSLPPSWRFTRSSQCPTGWCASCPMSPGRR